jgi:hypothetical protein
MSAEAPKDNIPSVENVPLAAGSRSDNNDSIFEWFVQLILSPPIQES